MIAMSNPNATYGTRDVLTYIRYILRISVSSLLTTSTKSGCNSRPGLTVMLA